MLSIHLDKAGKKFGREWIFRRLTLELQAASKLAILGGNGSGKSTLLQMIAGYITPNEGNVQYRQHGAILDKSAVYSHVSIASPYLQLIEELTGEELASHAGRFKPFLDQRRAPEVLELAGLSHAKNKFVKQYSSGMKQRLKLALALLADTAVVLLDEPSSNLDSEAIEWYRNMVEAYTVNRTVVVCSNALSHEYGFCNASIRMEDYKKQVLS